MDIVMYTIYTRGACTECDAAKRYLNENDVEYKEVYLLTENDIKEIKSFLPRDLAEGMVKLPLVFDDEHHFIGDKIDMIRDHQHKLYNTFDKQSLYNLLSGHVCSVVFEKVNGELRQMKCTLMEDNLPEGYRTTSQTDRSADNFLAVYDLENDGWRGFRVNSVKSITVMD